MAGLAPPEATPPGAPPPVVPPAPADDDINTASPVLAGAPGFGDVSGERAIVPPVAPAAAPPAPAQPPPQTPMQRLKAAGFNNSEVNEWSQKTRATLTAAGFSPPEIDAYAGVTPFDAMFGQSFADAPEGGALVGPTWDGYAATAPMGKVLSAFGVGHSDAWGASSLTPVTDELSDWMKKLEPEGNYTKNRTSAIKVFNEAFFRPMAMAAEMALHEAFVAIPAGIEGAAQHGGPLGEALFGPVAAGMEAFPAGHLTGFPHLNPAVGGAIAARAAADASARSAALDALDPRLQIPTYIREAHEQGLIGTNAAEPLPPGPPPAPPITITAPADFAPPATHPEVAPEISRCGAEDCAGTVQ